MQGREGYPVRVSCHKVQYIVYRYIDLPLLCCTALDYKLRSKDPANDSTKPKLPSHRGRPMAEDVFKHSIPSTPWMINLAMQCSAYL